MRLVDAHARLLQIGCPVFQTSDAAAHLKIRNDHASQVLTRLASAGHLINLRRGVWAIPGKIDRLALPGILTAPFPSYVSMQTALYYHGMVSQIPTVVYAATIGRTRRFPTPLGMVSAHHLQPSFFFGFEVVGDHGVQIATPEKALFGHPLSQARQVEVILRLAGARASLKVQNRRSAQNDSASTIPQKKNACKSGVRGIDSESGFGGLSERGFLSRCESHLLPCFPRIPILRSGC